MSGPAATTEIVSTPAGDVAVDMAGHGATLLCLHGIGSLARSFRYLLSAPPAGWRVAAWDAPGFGRSTDPPAPPGMDGYADAAAAVLTALGGPGAVLGVSWGGVVATRVALRHAELVRALVLLGSSAGSGRDPERATAMRGRASDLEAIGPGRLAANRGPRLVSVEASPHLRDEVIATMGDALRLPGYGWAAEAMAATDHTDRLPDVSAPALVVAGAADTVTGPPEAERLCLGLTHASLHLIEGAGHLANQERPAQLDALLHPFLTTLTTPAGGRP